MRNRFYFGKEVRGEAFTNRREETKQLAADIEQGQNIIIYSPRRYGKTSLIKRVLENVKDRGVLVFYLDLFPATNIKDFVKIYAEALATAEPPSRFKTFVKLLGMVLPRLFPKIVIKPSGETEISFEFEKILAEKEPLLKDLYEAADRIAQKKRKRAVVVFDEFQEILKLEERDKIERELRSHFQKHQNVSYVFLGSKRHLMQEMFKDKNRPLYNCGRHFPLGKIGAFDFKVFIGDQFSRGGFSIKPGEIDRILGITECHPYYTQLFCHILWDKCAAKKEIKKEDINQTLVELLIEEEHAYANIWEDLSSTQRVLLKAMALEDPLSMFSQEFLIKYGLRSVSAIQKAKKTLEKKELIERGNGHWTISDLFFKKWVASKVV